MKNFKFTGKIKSGIGKHSNLIFPCKNQLNSAPLQWPEKLYPGSLNIKISSSGYPKSFDFPEGVKKLDDGSFIPALIIPKSKIQNFLLLSLGIKGQSIIQFLVGFLDKKL